MAQLLDLHSDISSEVCLFLDPRSLWLLKSSHHSFARLLDIDCARDIFESQVKRRLAIAFHDIGRLAAPSTGEDERSNFEGSCLLPVLTLASSVEVMSDIVANCTSYTRLVGPSFVPVRHAMGVLHRVASADKEAQLTDSPGGAKRSPFSKQLLLRFAEMSDLIPRLAAFLRGFTPRDLPTDVFVSVCETLCRFLRTEELKHVFIQCGGLTPLLRYLKHHKEKAEVLSAGFTCLICLSARAKSCIKLLVRSGVHLIAATAVKEFPIETHMVTRAMGLLANLSNVPAVCPKLTDSGWNDLARDFLIKRRRTAPNEDISMEFAQRLLWNLQTP